jgi:hypothetical protein
VRQAVSSRAWQFGRHGDGGEADGVVVAQSPRELQHGLRRAIARPARRAPGARTRPQHAGNDQGGQTHGGQRRTCVD